ncbi:hypothetical protein J1N35_040990 [Gossypium stocksii]|uniref:Uncharacterized protein n=1 Tax=Gossypium stocksii TaxID=47602 RepID=A0A9D3UF08_9ROSI|nr:hypothetical protein J1N35_040990 [Gossypium stocksii]
MAIYNFIRKHVGQNDADFMEYKNINKTYENIINLENVHDGETDYGEDDDDDKRGGGSDKEVMRLSMLQIHIPKSVKP